MVKKDQRLKQAKAKSYSLEDFKTGDLVWASVKGYPRWPGQIADPDKASERHLAIRKLNTLLVYFFGDRSFGWFQPDTLAPFEELFEQLSTIKTKQPNFRRAVEEGKEVLDQRAGRPPATQHYAWDALDPADERNQPGYQEGGESDGDGEGGWRRDLRPPDPTVEVAQRCKAPAALAWLRVLAADPHAEPTEAAQTQASSAARLVFSLMREQLAKPAAGKLRRAAAPQARAGARKPRTTQVEEDMSDANDVPDEVAAAKGSGKGAEDAGSQGEVSDEGLQAEAAAQAAQAAAKAERRAARAAGKAAAKTARRAQAALATLTDRGLSNAERELRVQLPEVAGGLATIARSPLAFLDGQVGSTGAAALRWREAAYAKSRFRTDGAVGGLLLKVLGGGGVAYSRKRRAEAGVPPPPDLEHVGKAAGDWYRFYLGAEYVPSTREAFDEQLAAFYERHGAAQAAPVLDHQPLGLWELMQAVAHRGGYQAASALRQWGAVTRVLRPESTTVSSSSMALVKHYRKLLLAFEADLVASTGATVEMRVVQRGAKSPAKSPAQSAAKAAWRDARVAAAAKAGRSLAETPEGAALGFGDAAGPAASSDDDDGGSSDDGATSSSDDDSSDHALLASRMRQAEGRAAEAGLGAATAKRARLQAAADRKRARSMPSQPAEQDPVAKRQAAERTARMLSDFDDLHNPAPQPGSGAPQQQQQQQQQQQRLPAVPAKRAPHPRPVQARAPDSDRKKAIVLRFPKGYALPSQSQILLAGTNSGQLTNKDVSMFSKSYAACLEYANAETAKKAEHWFKAHADRIFKVARSETIRVTREEKKDKDAQQRPGAGAAAASRAAAQRPRLASSTPPAAAAGAAANVGVPFDPRAGVPYMPPETGSGGSAAPPAAGVPYDPRRGVAADPRQQAAPPPAAAPPSAAAPPPAPIPYDPRREGQVPQQPAQPPVQQFDQQWRGQPPAWQGTMTMPPVRHPQPTTQGLSREQPAYGQSAAQPPLHQAVPPPAAGGYGAGQGAAHGFGGSTFGGGPVPPLAAAAGCNSPSRVELPIGPELAALLQSMPVPAPSAAPPPAAPPADAAQQPRDVQSDLMSLLAKLHGTS